MIAERGEHTVPEPYVPRIPDDWNGRIVLAGAQDHGRTSKGFFSTRLWNADDLVGMVLAHYDRLSEGIRAELPLKRVWALVLEAEE